MEMKIGKAYVYKTHTICPNYGGWVIVHDSMISDYNIYKSIVDAINAEKKRKDGSQKSEPRIIGKMTDEQFINALNFD